MSTLAIIITLLLIFWYFEAGSVRQMVEDATGKPVRPIIVKKKPKRSGRSISHERPDPPKETPRPPSV